MIMPLQPIQIHTINSADINRHEILSCNLHTNRDSTVLTEGMEWVFRQECVARQMLFAIELDVRGGRVCPEFAVLRGVSWWEGLKEEKKKKMTRGKMSRIGMGTYAWTETAIATCNPLQRFEFRGISHSSAMTVPVINSEILFYFSNVGRDSWGDVFWLSICAGWFLDL
jgi:hypothetical protein